MAVSSFTFYLLVRTYPYGAEEITLSAEKQDEYSEEVFEFCYEQNSIESSFSESRERAVGIEKGFFGFGSTKTSEFTEASVKATEEGKDITEYTSNMTTKKVEAKFILEEGEVLLSYAPIVVLCYTLNGGEKEYCNIPKSNIITKKFDETKLSEFSNNNKLDQFSWEEVNKEFPDKLHLTNVQEEIKKMSPKQISPIAVPVSTLSSEPNAPKQKKVAIQSVKNGNYLKGYKFKDNTVEVKLGVNSGRTILSHNDLAWVIEDLHNGYYAIKCVANLEGGLCYMDGSGEDKPSTHRIPLRTKERDPKNDAYLQWKIIPKNGTSNYQIESRSSGFRLDVREDSDDAKLWLTKDHKVNAPRMQFRITEIC